MKDATSIVHRAAGYVVVEKASGFLSVPGKGEHKQDCVIARVRETISDATGPMIVHRLDMDTSGLMVVALDKDTQRELSRQFELREVEKAYMALVSGVPVHEEGLIDVPMRTDIDNRPRQIVDFVHGKPSQTKYRVTSHEIDRSRVRFEPVTGRSHQIRVHAATPTRVRSNDLEGEVFVAGGLGCPIVGDPLYGGDVSLGESGATTDRLMLHASELSFWDPATGRRVRFESRTPF